MTTGDVTWDLLVVGGGTAGIVGAKTAARLGARVALVERDRTGGDCLWTGCVPSKSLLAAASHAAEAHRASVLGVNVSDIKVDFPGVMAHVRSAIAAIEPVDSPQALEDAGVVVIQGEAVFTDASTVAVDGRRIPFQQALVATGSSPAVPPIPGLAQAQPLTSDTVWDLHELPGRLVVMGGGSIGVELSQAFARLGSEVTLVEVLPRILSGEDPDAASLVQRALQKDGVRILTNHRVGRVDGTPDGPGQATLEGEGKEFTQPYDALLVAVGRRPRNEGLGLDVAGVALDDHDFVKVDARLRTSNPRIWAAGDITPHPQFTHVAGVHASLAVSNAVLGLRRTVDDESIPRVTFTDPEVAAVGAATWNEDDTPKPRTITRLHADVDRAVAEGRRDGFARLVIDDRHRVRGGTMVGPRAGETVAEVALAVRKGMSTGDLAGTMHAYPTYADGPWNAAIADVQSRLESPRVRTATTRVARLRRWWLARRPC